MASSSNNDPPSPPSEFFSFGMLASTLKHAIGALSDPHLNSSGTARIDVSEAGFEITVRGGSVEPQEQDPFEVVGFLSLNADALVRFKCNIRVTRMIKLDKKIAEFVDLVGDDDIIKVFSSNENVLSFLPFKLGPDGLFQQTALEMNFIKGGSLLKKFPTVSCVFEVTLPPNTMNPLLQSITEDLDYGEVVKLARASVEKNVCIQAGASHVDIKGDTQHLYFKMTNWMVLKTASLLANTCYFYYVKDPSDQEHIMLRYSLNQFGDFVILKTTQECFVDKHHPTLLGTFGSCT